MPELPEVHTIVAQLDRALRGRRIVRLVAWTTRKMFRPSLAAVARAVQNQRIARVHRRAKLILMELGSGATLAMHLKLTGRLLVRRVSDLPDPYTHARFSLDRGDELRFSDARKFGYIRLLVTPDAVARLLHDYGPEPFDRAFTVDRLAVMLHGRSTKIKTLLMDQTRISGIGNIYSDEALFTAGIDPRRRARLLKPDEVRRLHRAIIRELRTGIRHHGTSDQWYLDAHGKPGVHQRYLRVYGRLDEPCVRCGTPIRRVRLGGRSSHFCPRCQH